jgi:hypothetical protein
MAYAVMGGLVVATLLTLVFLPALYVAWFRIQPADASSDEQADTSAYCGTKLGAHSPASVPHTRPGFLSGLKR